MRSSLIRKILLLSLVSVFAVTSVGISVFTHFCKKDGISTSYFVQKSHHCKPIVEVEPCCLNKEKLNCNSSVNFENEKCCSDFYSNIKLNTAQEHNRFSINITLLRIQEFAVYSEYVSEVLLAKNEKVCVEPPPKYKNGKEILLFNQVFRL